MRRALQWSVLLLLVCGAVLLWRHLFPGPEERIRRRMGELQELASFRSSDGNLAVLADLQRLGALFARDAEVRLNVQGGPGARLVGRDEIVQAAAGARRAVGDLKVEFLDVVIVLGPDAHSAEVEATVRARQPGSDEHWIEELRFRFIETEEGWLIASVEQVPMLTGSGGGSGDRSFPPAPA